MKKVLPKLRKKIKISDKKTTTLKFWTLSFSVVLFAVVAIRGYQGVQAAPASTLYLDPATLSVSNGQSFTLDAKVNPGTNQVSAIELHVSFDHTKFNLTSISNNNSVFPQVLQAAQIDNANGTASIILGVALNNPPAYVTSTQTVATFSFNVVGSQGSSAINIDQTSVAAANGENGDVIVTRTPSQITIGRQFGIADFTVLVADWLQTKTSSADVNADGKVDARDLGVMMSNWGI